MIVDSWGLAQLPSQSRKRGCVPRSRDVNQISARFDAKHQASQTDTRRSVFVDRCFGLKNGHLSVENRIKQMDKAEVVIEEASHDMHAFSPMS